ncbi:MAG: hypothetical protein ACOCRX_12335 [Candidatus Woesearchaeota archaeon]
MGLFEAKFKDHNQFLFYDSLLDLDKSIPDSTFLKILKPYHEINTILGDNFSDKLRSFGHEVLNIQRLGCINASLYLFKESEGFESLLKNIRKIAKKILKTNEQNPNFKIYVSQLYRYFSELMIPHYIKRVSHSKITFQPKDLGDGQKSCDNIVFIDNKEIALEITSISTKNKRNLDKKIKDIFETKGRAQMSQTSDALLAIDLTKSGEQYFDIKKNQFLVKFPNWDYLRDLIRVELDKKMNSHLIGVVLIANIIVEENLKCKLLYKLTLSENINNSNTTILTNLFSK